MAKEVEGTYIMALICSVCHDRTGALMMKENLKPLFDTKVENVLCNTCNAELVRQVKESKHPFINMRTDGVDPMKEFDS